MSWFNKKTMSEQDFNEEEIFDGEAEDGFVDDKRRFDGEGERIKDDPKGAKTKSSEIIKLENELKEVIVSRLNLQ